MRLESPYDVEQQEKERMEKLKKQLKNPPKKTSFPIPADIHKKLKQKSIATGIEMRELILQAVIKSLE